MSHLNRRVSVILCIVVVTTSLPCSTSSILDPLTQLQQQHPNRVSTLPGQDFCINFEHYSGYVTVNEGTGRSLFYWLTEAVDDPSSKPLLLWLNGGPGCSAIAYGMAEEIGPFHINKDGKSLYLNPHSWNQVANLLFLDSPVGVGFSYPNNSSDNMNHGDKRTAEDSLAFLLKWVEQFPQYKGRDFYIAGESYAGHYVPQLSQAIVRHNSAVKEISINLKGFMVGNALIDDFNDHTGIFQFMWAAGMISDQTYKQLNLSCGTQSFVHPSLECNKAWNVAYNELGHIDPYSIFTPTCSAKIGITNQLVQRWHKLIRTTQSSESYDPCSAQHTMVYFNLPEVQNALHVQNKNASSKWQPCSNPVYKYWNDSASSMIDVYHELIRSGIRIWVFSGDTDAIVPVTSTRYSIVAMNLPTAGPWHAWYEDGQVGGWTQQYQGLTFVTVRGAGHEVPLHKPKQALTLFKSFMSGSPMPALRDSGPSSSLEQLSSNSTSSLASSILT